MKLVLIGPPGAGKGTQADILANKLCIPTISTGDILRDAVKRKSPVGLEANEYMSKGSLVPDEVIIGIVIDRITKQDCKNGFILDGMPRTITQAEALDEHGVVTDTALSFEMPDISIEKRLGGRRACVNCSATFHIESHPPKQQGLCDICGGDLITRADDEASTVKHRLKQYHLQTEPLKAYYKSQNKLKTVDCIPGVEEMTAAICGVLGI